jgi:hypothetical protein
MSHHVFISHTTRDQPVADAICAAIERQGIRSRIAPRDVLPGVDWGAASAAGSFEIQAPNGVRFKVPR